MCPEALCASLARDAVSRAVIRGDWRERAPARGHPSAWWYANGDPDVTAATLAVCRSCLAAAFAKERDERNVSANTIEMISPPREAQAKGTRPLCRRSRRHGALPLPPRSWLWRGRSRWRAANDNQRRHLLRAARVAGDRSARCDFASACSAGTGQRARREKQIPVTKP